MKGASMTPERSEPARVATTRVALKSRTGSALPLRACSPASVYAMAAEVAALVMSST